MSALSLVLFQIAIRLTIDCSGSISALQTTTASPGATGAELPITALNVNNSKHWLLLELLSEV